MAEERELSNLEQQGLIQCEFTHELAWNVLKDHLENQGIANMISSRDATREAFRDGLISDGEAWMDMIKARNQTTHTYNPAIADDIAEDILQRFDFAFEEMAMKFTALSEQQDL